MAERIESWAREMLGRPGAFGTLATVSADGSAHQAVIWFLVRDDVIVMNSAVGRIWPTNLLRDPRCSLVVEAGYDWVGVRGRVEVITDQATAQADIAEMARRYHAEDPQTAEAMIRDTFEPQERISFLLHPDRVTEHPDA
ncbi:MAG: pyridoxamine 5'-phosphate oxidase family protein [Chloroflexota bacterium]|nr:pyridoxamine 5'-phosphate oxidase family protein [Chloroflexota bacterium]